jgi:Cellulase (glycosyl hydrolase family 5)
MLVLGTLGGGPDARAMPVTVQDDALMLHRSGAEVQATARRMANIGVDRVRLTASWSTLAPSPNAKRMPKFEDTDSDAYPREHFVRLDRAVKAVASNGMTPQIDIAFFAPLWGVRREVRVTNPGRHRWEIRTKRYAHFAEAVAKRYNGSHRDPARSNQRLPAVRIWATWNEPNHSAFLLPQWRRYQGKWMPRSPHLYRRLHERGYAAIKRVNPANQVLIGNTAALGGTAVGPRRTIAPLRFIRELACVDRRGRPLEDRPECAKFRPLQADGLAHHPYSLYDRPDVPSIHPEQVTMGDLDRLSALLDRLHDLGRTTTRFPILITEYGYETNPPDRFRGVSLRRQARYHGLATFLAWRKGDVTSFAQFLMNDIGPPPGAGNDPVKNARNWQSGLYFHDGRAKQQAVQAFRLPFWAEARSLAGQEVVLLFGQVRPSQGRKRMEVEVKAPDGSWLPVRTYETRPAGDPSCGTNSASFLTDVQGFFLRVTPYHGAATYRARWIKGDGSAEYGVTIPVRAPEPVSG